MLGYCKHWAEYFQQLLQVDPPAVSLDAIGVVISVSDPTISEEPPTLTEVWEAISKLRGGKAMGICRIPAELLKARGEPITWGLRTALAAA